MKKTDSCFDVSLHKELLLRVGRGESVAFGQLYDLLSKPLYALAYRILNNKEEVEEVIQDVFVVIWNRAADYDARLSRPFSWMIVITRRLCWNKLRSKGRQLRKISALESERHADVNPKAEKEPGEHMEKLELSAHMRERISAFPELQRKCLESAIYDGFTHEEISVMLDIPLGTVKTWIRRGILRLKSELGVEG